MLEEEEWTPPGEFDEYRIVRQLGRGSMGSVYLAQDIVLDRPVAVKFLGALRPDPVERERFLVEARAVARIHHPNVMSIFRVGEVKGRLYLVTEYVRGENLADLDLPLPPSKVLAIGIGLARALGAAHRQGVLHRDIKLSNAVIEEGVQVKLLDFGLAKLVDTSKERRSEAAREVDERALENTGELLVRAATNARLMVVQRLADTMKLEPPSTTGPTPKVPREPSGGDANSLHRTPRAEGAGHGERRRLGAWNSRTASITRAGTVMGTPHYMAPELWLADPASRRSDVYGLGVVLFILCAGRPPHDAESPFELAMQVQERDPSPLLDVAPTVDPRLALVIDRCLARDPYDRYASGDELRAALDVLVAPPRSERSPPVGNPYRGLQAFEAEHRSLFFGRSAEVRSVIERLRTDSFVVVAGDSGVGKSSLCRAGVIPAVLEGELASTKSWRSVTMTPGRFPRQSFVSVIARGFGLTEEEVSELLTQEPELLVRALRKQLGETGGCLILLDQFEEFVTIAEASEVEVIGPMIVRLLAGIPGLRVLATVRGDFLTRVVTVPGLGDEVSRGIFLLRPLSPEGAREAIVGPAQVHGVSFESDELVDGLVEAGVKGSLPLLQFALAELWESREPSASVITDAELRQIGGVTGALARHADGVLASLLPDQRSAARRLLMRLVTLDNTRASLTEEELVAKDEASKTALDALVRGRLLVVREAGERMVYEIAHEALVGGWSQLAGWLVDEEEARAVMHRLEQAAAEWERLGKRREGLWSSAQLAECGVLDRGVLRVQDRDFLRASEVNATRGRRLRRAGIIAVPLVAASIYLGVQYQAQESIRERVDQTLVTAEELRGSARRSASEAEALRDEAFRLFDSGDVPSGEEVWQSALARWGEASKTYSQASQAAETALNIDSHRDDARVFLADVLLERIVRIEDVVPGQGSDSGQVELMSRLELYDSEGTRQESLRASANLYLRVVPADAKVELGTYAPDVHGHLKVVNPRDFAATRGEATAIEPGSHLLTLTAPGYATALLPVMLRRGEDLPVVVEMVEEGRIPPGFQYVPAGRSLFGSDGDAEVRTMFLSTVPMHQVWTSDYVIARNETTFSEYIEFLDSVDKESRDVHIPRASEMSLSWDEERKWVLSWARGDDTYEVSQGEIFEYPDGAQHDPGVWGHYPVVGLTPNDISAYSEWLDSSGKVPGARLCTDYEWERAARGADSRNYPQGDLASPKDANFDLTYGKDLRALGLDEVGSYPLSRSPFGVDDMAGNVFEWVASSLEEGRFLARGGGFRMDALQMRVVTRELLNPEFRSNMVGVRICAPIGER